MKNVPVMATEIISTGSNAKEKLQMGFKVSETYSGGFLKAEHMTRPTTNLTVTKVTQHKFEEENQTQLVLHFSGTDKCLGLNATNARMMAKLFGDDTDSWIGQVVCVYKTTTEFRGRTVDCLRVQAPQAAAAKPAPEPAEVDPTVDDDIPF